MRLSNTAPTLLAVFVLLATYFAPAALAQSLDEQIAANGGGCTTSGGQGLARQLVRVQICANPDIFGEFTPHAGIVLSSSRVHPLATLDSVEAIRAAADQTTITVNSAFRPLSEQYMLYEGGGCGAAATPGRSNHQGGAAIDVQNYSSARSALVSAGCVWPNISNDPWHYDCPGPDHRPESVRTFQRLWNHNNPGDQIAEDGVYGPQTGSRLGRSPANGFAAEPCEVDQYGAEYVEQSFPLASADPVVVASGETYAGSITLRNIGSLPWNENTFLATSEPRDFLSPLAASDWPSANRAAQVSGTVAPGETFEFSFSLEGPELPGEYCQYFGVVQEGEAWFSDSGHLGPADNLLQVCLVAVDSGSDGAPDAGADVGAADSGSDAGDDAASDVGGDGFGEEMGGCGCRVGASSSPDFMILLALGFLWIRRRRS